MEPLITPSQSALLSAAARAAHLHVDLAPHVLVDEQAEALCRTDPAAGPSPLGYQIGAPEEPVLAAARVATLARSRFAEDVLHAAGVDQHVVLGAGLDTSAHRAPAGVRTWLVDLPGVLAWRTERFAAAGLADVGTPVPVDLTGGVLTGGAVPGDELLGALVDAGLDPDRPVVVVWLGTTMYLAPAEVEAVLHGLADLPTGSWLVLDHVLPPEHRDAAGRAYARVVAAMVGATGEPWRSAFAPEQIEGLAATAGWRVRRAVDEHAALPSGTGCRGARPQRLVRLVAAQR
jgi:methyltransferase (TIGR00027 family)